MPFRCGQTSRRSIGSLKRMEKLELHQPIEPNWGRAVLDHESGGGHDDYRGEKREGSAVSHLIFFPASSFRGTECRRGGLLTLVRVRSGGRGWRSGEFGAVPHAQLGQDVGAVPL